MFQQGYLQFGNLQEGCFMGAQMIWNSNKKLDFQGQETAALHAADPVLTPSTRYGPQNSATTQYSRKYL